MAAAPVVSSFTPASGTIGTTVTITGGGFTGATQVTFGNPAAAAPPTVKSDTTITATVPATASTGKITVTAPGGTAASTATFTVNPGIALSAAGGHPAGTVTVSGAGFGRFEAVDVYFDTTDEALATTSATGTFAGLTIAVPAFATPGAHWVTAAGRHSGAAAQAAYTVGTNWAQFHYSGKHKGANPTRTCWRPGTSPRSTRTGPSPPAARSTPPRRWSTGPSTRAPPTAACTRWTPPPGPSCGALPPGSVVASSPAVAGGVIYIGSGDGNVYALNAATGAQLWKFTTGGPVHSSPAVANGVVYVGSYDDNVYALNAATGAQLWKFTTGFFIDSSPAVAGGVIYVGSADGNVYALDAYAGAQLWSFTTAGFVDSSPAVANGVVYIGSDDHNMYAFDLAGGTAAAARPATGTLHPNYSLHPQHPAPARAA